MDYKLKSENNKTFDEAKPRNDSNAFKTFCNDVPPSITLTKVSKVMIKIQNGAHGVAWAVNSILIPNYEINGIIYYHSYSMAPPETRFWVSSDSECEILDQNTNLYPCCSNGRWCPLYLKGTNENNI